MWWVVRRSPRTDPAAASGTRAKESSAVSDQLISDLLGEDAGKAVRLAGGPQALYERHLLFDQVTDPRSASARDRFEAVARSLRDLLSRRWLQTQQAHDRANPKRVYYLS